MRQQFDGALVVEVIPGGPGSVAGLQPTRRSATGELSLGDLIVGVGSVRIRQVEDLLSAIEERDPGQTVALRVWRGCDPRKELELQARLVLREQLALAM